MNQDQIEATLTFRAHELGTDAAGKQTDLWLAWVSRVETILGHDLDGDQESDGYSIDRAHDFYADGLTSGEAATEFEAIKAEILWTAKNCSPE